METSVLPMFILPWRFDSEVTSAQTSIQSRPAASATSFSRTDAPPLPAYPIRTSAMSSFICSL